MSKSQGLQITLIVISAKKAFIDTVKTGLMRPNP